MADTPLLFSLLFFLACFSYSFLGIYILHINSKSALNRLFFAMSLSMAWWAFGYSIAVSASDVQTCEIWRRVAAIGWGSVYGIMLHCAIVLTGRTQVLKTWWSRVLIYVPAAVTIAVFSFSGFAPDEFVKTSSGWINAVSGSFWHWFFNVYYCSYVIAVLWLVITWGRSKDASVKKQAWLIAATLAAALVMGTMVDMLGIKVFQITLPEMTPIVAIIPATAIFYSIKKYGLLRPKPITEDEAILSNKARMKIYNYVSAGFIAGAFLNFVSQYLIYNDDLIYVLTNSAILALFGIAAYAVQRAKLKKKVVNLLNGAILTIAIPVITLRFSQYAGLTVWALPFALLIIALTFNKRTMLVAIAASMVLTEVYLWFVFPNEPVFIDGGNYIGRIGLFCIATWIAIYVNKVYTLRIKENVSKIRFQKLVTRVSTDFLNVTEEGLGAAIDDMLLKTGTFFDADRAYIYFYDMGGSRMAGCFQWRSGNIAQEEGIDDSPEALPWITERIGGRNTVHIRSTKELPHNAGDERLNFEGRGVQSSIVIPIEYQGSVLGLIGLEAQEENKWRDDHTDVMKILANICAEALAKIETEIKIKQMAYFDHLTNLPNRTLFMDRITQAIHQAKRTGRMLGVIFLDLDDFKNVNDTMGHQGGDELLCNIAQKLLTTVRKADTVSRFGGDEFLIMVSDIRSLSDVVHITEGLMEHFNEPFVIKGQEFFITASAGVTMYPIDGEDPEKLIKNADIAMYKAKEKGKNQYVLCSSEMKEEVGRKMKLTTLLYHALDNGELTLYYQPQICLKTNRIIGVEALLRWKHPKLGMIYPKTFIPLAEQTGLINPIGEWVLRTACAQNKAWQDMGLPPVRMGVNVSVYQLKNPGFIELIEEVLTKTQLAPGDLEIEITESMIMKESDFIISVLCELKKLGLVISIDDFGTEYSSLSRLKMLPIDRIKMDMQFVHGIEKSDKDKAITKVIITLAQNLGVKVVAEGVETEKQLQFLSMRMCDEVQGFYCYRPAPADEVEKILRQSLLDDKAAQAGV